MNLMRLTPASNCLCLNSTSSNTKWIDLIVLPKSVANPMLVSDMEIMEYMYVLGGEKSGRCVRLSKIKPRGWEDLPNLPEGDELHGGAELNEEYNGNLYSGSVWHKDKVRVLTKTEFLPLKEDPKDSKKKTWNHQTYVKDNNILHLKTILHESSIAAADLSKAFGSLNYDILLCKLNYYGLH